MFQKITKSKLILSLGFVFLFSLVPDKYESRITPKEIKLLHPSSESICSSHAHQEEETSFSLIEQARIEKIRTAINSNSEVVWFPLVAHTFVDGGCCNDNATQAEVQSEVDFLNNNYAIHGFNVRVLLFYYEHVDLDLDDSYNPDDNQAIWDEYAELNAINVFYMDFDNGGGSQHYDWTVGSGMVVVNQDYLDDGWSLIHELGHYWGLAHTWGDDIPDTPPCLNLEFGSGDGPATFHNTDNCSQFYAEYNDPNNGYVMSPSVYNNAMNYGVRECSQSFSVQQVSKMWERVPVKINQLGLFCNSFFNANCPSTRVMNGSAYGQYAKASDDIESTQEIIWSVRQSYIGATNEVILKPGFSANYGANVLINNAGCNCN